MQQYPSIFNDVIGPVMIGSSSSHTAASVRIGRMIRQLAGGPLARLEVAYDRNSSLAAAHLTQFVDTALLAGMLGYDTSDAEILHGFQLADEAGISYAFTVKEIGPGHPNTYYVTATRLDGAVITVTALSTGGGMFQIIDYQGFPLLIDGGFYELLLRCPAAQQEAVSQALRPLLPQRHLLQYWQKGEDFLLQVQSETPLAAGFGAQVAADSVQLQPVLPILSQLQPTVPFITGAEILRYAENHPELDLWQLALAYEGRRSGESEAQIFARMQNIIGLLRHSLDTPLAKEGVDRILPNQAQLLDTAPPLLGGRHQQLVIGYVTRLMDIKTSLGVIVAAPTAGACACLPGTVFALGEELSLTTNQLVEAMLAASLVGVLLAAHSTFAAEVAGCQAECGAGSGMAAAACAQIAGAPPSTCLAAASLALQNVFGLTCDPVAMRVEVPCLGKNLLSAFNAIASANMAVCGFAQVIPLDETIAAFDAVGKALPRELRCTGLGGLTITPSGQSIARRLAGK